MFRPEDAVPSGRPRGRRRHETIGSLPASPAIAFPAEDAPLAMRQAEIGHRQPAHAEIVVETIPGDETEEASANAHDPCPTT